MYKNIQWNVGKYLLYRLEQMGLKHIFGIPGDYALEFFDEILASNIDLINTCNELNAAYAADGYARINGLGAIAITYAVGGFSALNGVAGAYAEYIPMVVISGSPKVINHEQKPMLHHTLEDYDISLKIFETITVDAVIIKDASKAPELIDRVLKNCVLYKRPVYIELPRDIVQQSCQAPGEFNFTQDMLSNKENLTNAVNHAMEIYQKAQKPAIIPGAEIERFSLKEETLKLIERAGCPFATMLMGKTVLSETHHQFIGHYYGAFSQPYVKDTIENSDCLLMLGTFSTDSNYAGYTAKINPEKTILANRRNITIGEKVYPQVSLKDFIHELLDKIPMGNSQKYNITPASKIYCDCETRTYEPVNKQKLNMDRFYKRISNFIQKGDIVLAETGTATFALGDVMMPQDVTFIAQSYYMSIGYTVGAALGAALAAPKRRVLVFVGDGSFQLTCQEISTMIRYFQNPIIFLINNDGYTIERLIHDGSYNNIQPWKYNLLPQIFSGAAGHDVFTEDELEKVLENVRHNNTFSFVELHFDKWDYSSSLRELFDSLRQKAEATAK